MGPDPKIWDGHATSAENAAREARGNASLDDQIAQIHRQKGLNQAPPPPQPPKPIVVAPPAPQPVAMVPPVAPMIVGVPVRPAMVVPAPVFAPAPAPPVFMHQGQMMDDDEPAAKRSRTEENLIPEGEFLARNHSPVTMKVSVPNMPDKAEWKLEGQMLTITLGLTETVNSIKSKIMEEIGMPQGKQTSTRVYIFEGCQQPGLLQHYAGNCVEFAIEGEGWKKEIIMLLPTLERKSFGRSHTY